MAGSVERGGNRPTLASGMELTPTDRNPNSESGIGGEKMGLVRPRKNRPFRALFLRSCIDGVVICTEVLSQAVPPLGCSILFPHLSKSLMGFVWATWRMPTLAELVSALPSCRVASDAQRAARGKESSAFT
jgi:hypothetical protein